MHTQLYDIPGTWSGRLAIMPRPRGGDWLDDEVRAWREQAIQVIVSGLTKDEIEELQLGAERDLCEANGIEYIPFPIADRGVPSSLADMARLARLLEKRLASGVNIVFHCRQGSAEHRCWRHACWLRQALSREPPLSGFRPPGAAPFPTRRNRQIGWSGSPKAN
jgi:hypothetical protein